MICYPVKGGDDVSYTRFGELLRILRVKHHEVMGDLAKVLEVKVPFLSAVENGKKNVPADWIERITVHYGLSEAEKVELFEAAEESRTQYKINAERSGIPQRRAALSFARSFDEMDDETALRILELLSKRGAQDN